MIRLQFSAVAITAAIITASLAVLWTIWPELFFWLWNIPASDTARFLGRRIAALFAGLTIMLALARNAPVSPLRDALALGMGTACLLLAASGIHAILVGSGGSGLWLAVAVELALASAFSLVERKLPQA